MITFRVTAKVAARLKHPLAAVVPTPAPSSIFGDWYVNLLIIQRQHLLLLISERTLLPVLLPAKELASFPARFPSALKDVLLVTKIPESKIEAELTGMEQYRFAKTASRQVLGSMNDFANMLEAHLGDGAPLTRQALRLGRTPCGPIGMNNPLRETATAFGITLDLNPFEL